MSNRIPNLLDLADRWEADALEPGADVSFCRRSAEACREAAEAIRTDTREELLERRAAEAGLRG